MRHEQLRQSLNAYQSFPKNHHQGSGLGLSLVKLIAETYHGSLAADIIDQGQLQYSLRLPVVQTKYLVVLAKA